MRRRVIIVGAGIVGSALAAELSSHEDCEVTVVDQAPEGELRGSTGHAPGFVGILNETTVLTELAQDSVRAYRELHHAGVAGFDTVGGLEIATTRDMADALEGRAATATAFGLPARLLDAAEAAALAPRLVDPEKVMSALHFPSDGTARADVVTAALRARATAAGARFIADAPLIGVDIRGDRIMAAVTQGEVLAADDVVLACGVWGPAVADFAAVELPLTPVAHPYAYGPPHSARFPRSPFVRWPEFHVYARDHGDRDGLGSYDHEPLPVATLAEYAEDPWPGVLFDDAIARAMSLLPETHRFPIARRLNGVFSMTADNLPLLGPHVAVRGLWIAEAIWVTHAAGAAAALAAMMYEEDAGTDTRLLDPNRFDGWAGDDLRKRALAQYRDIYASTQGKG